ncbi:hypothetical protein [Planococcus glaciei]|uniref:hypothetical protein n=1 Tax=Planococcus glaciei TaxID=459472 RepID=UPI001C73176B|nr:hypothetical protein [Planococcus glaciei]MBX0315338.1 hypothetical protein [Planococcus glaciei]
MIYKKEANFPYPVLTNSSTSYTESEFKLDIELEENTHMYRFEIKHAITSSFLSHLLEIGKAALILVLQSKDNKFYVLENGQRHIEIPKSRISLSNRTSLQLHLQSTQEISFRDNFDLNDFYTSFKNEILVPKHSMLGFSNIVLFDGSSTNPLELFEKKLDETLSSDIKIELGPETIIIHYRNSELQFGSLPKSHALNNTYVYMGLRAALQEFIVKYSEEGEDTVEISQINTPTNMLDFKLYQLMTKKMVNELNLDVLDHVIYLISDRIIEKHATAVKELAANGS